MAGAAVLSKVLQELLSKLSSPILDEFWLLWGVKKEKQKLQSNLSRIKAMLEDAERQQMDLMTDKDRLGKLKDVAYDAEDLFDEFLVEALRRKVENQDGMGRKVGNFFSLANPLVFRFKIAHKMKDLRKRFEELAEENNYFQSPEGVARSQPQIPNPRETASSVPVWGVYGRDYQKENYIDSLINSGNEEVLSVIPIVGMGGLGKTTLAQYVYDDGRVETHFNLKMWVYVSEEFNVGKILAKILESATKSTPTYGSSMDLLNTRVKEKLSGKRYLLVLDDVWNEDSDKWDRLRTALQCGAKGSKILVTTRSDTVARRMDALRRPPLETLSAAESWTLFEKVAHPHTAAFVSIGKEIVRKCGGVPLAIKTLGGMLRNETGEREWQSVRDSELWKQTDNEGGILSILRLSYDHLTSSLKQCFAYCAVIPKGCRFDKAVLIKKWIAQGFIHSDDENELLEEEAEKYFNALLRRSLFQVDVDNDSYKMHDLIHDLLRSVAGKECFIVEASVMNDLTRHLALFNDETRHLALCNDYRAKEPKNLDALKKCKKLRSMMIHGPIDTNVCFSFRCLRVLDLSFRKSFCFLPNSIDKLRHLRYFDISYTGITELPETICNLHNLQTLRVLGISLQKWPNNMKRMISLRHIEFNGRNDFPLPKGIGELTFLRTLPNSKFIIAKESGAGIEELKDLNLIWGNIHIVGLDNITSVGCAGEADLLKAKKHLNSLKLSWSGNETVAAEGNAKEVIGILEPHSDLKELSVENYTGLGFPSWMTEKLTNLNKISLLSCKRCEWLPPLGKLHSLQSLVIYGMDAVKHIVEFDGSHNYKDLFPSLKYLGLSNMPNLEGWSSPQEDGDGDEKGRERDKQVIFKCLRTLKIHDCPKLARPPRLPLLPSLESLEIGGMGWDMIQIWSPHEADDGTPMIFRSVRTLSISNCPKLIGLPMFLLPALEELKMSEVGCERIEFSRSHSLKSVDLFDMPNLERWSLQEVDDDKDEQVTFLSLRTLRISKCPKLISLCKFLLPALEELKMEGVGCEEIEFSRSKSLKKVELIEMPNLERWSTQQADDDKDAQVTFLSLRTLRISKCPKLISLCKFLLPALEELKMEGVGCEKIEFSRSKSLKKVELIEMPNLESWSKQEADDDKDEQVTLLSLRTLRISKCPKLISLRQFLLPALEELEMEGVGCEKIEFSRSKSLKKVELTEMPNLERWSPQEADDDEQLVFDRLVKLVVRECPRMVRLPHLLPSLEKLEISESNEILLASVANYTSLSQLSIYGLPEVKHLPKELGPNHTSVRILEIKKCPKLISLSNQLENLLALKELIVEGCNDLVLSLPNGLQQQQQQRSPPLNSLEVLDISDLCEKQTSLPGDGIVLPSLKRLEIDSCKNIESLSADMLQNLTYLSISDSPKVCSSLVSPKNLESLEIYSCPESVMMKLLESMENLTSLVELSIGDCPDMRSLPKSVKTFTSLTDLRISICPSMRSLPEWVGDLTLLTDLTIFRCPAMMSLPEGLQRLKNLKLLEILGCPVLGRRVQCNKGQDWHKVAHVQSIIIVSEDTEGEESSDQCPHLLLHPLKKLEKLLPLPSCCSSSPSTSPPPST